jgi:hypothetical protein
MKNSLNITNKNPNIKLVKTSLLLCLLSIFIFVFLTGIMIGEAVKTQRLSRQNVNISKNISLLNQELIQKSKNLNKNSRDFGYEIKTSQDKYFVQKTIDSKYTYLFR